MTFRSPHARGIVGSVATFVLLASCAPDERALCVQHRLVDQQARAEGHEKLPLATIRDETRYVLRASQKTQWPILFRSAAPDDGHISRSVPLPQELAGSERVVLCPLLKLGEQVIDLPRQQVEIERRSGRSLVPIEIELPTWAARRDVTLVVNGYGVSDEPILHETAPLAVAPDASLELGIGILEPAWDQGAVRFSVLACDASGCSAIVEETLDPAREQDRAWRDLRVPLHGLAGRPLWLRFETTLLVEKPGSFSLPVISNPTIFSPEPRREDEINVILISLDTLRADRLPSYGYALDTAPFLERAFGMGGTVVEHLVAAEAMTSPAHMSMFTSLYPSVHRVSGPLSSLAPGVPTLTQILREEGFETGAITEDGVLDITQGFGRGFNSYAENKSVSYLLPQGEVELTLERGREWLRRHGRKRFFLFLHTYQVHFPYQPPKAYRKLFPVAAASHPPHPDLPPSHDPALYDREIRFVDDQLRLFFDTLRDEGLAKRTVVIVTSDHGEEFLEHGMLGHGTALHAEIVHVPLLVRGPGIARGRRVPEPVGHVDLMPTILDLAGVSRRVFGMGRSFAELLREGKSPEPRSPRPLYSEAWRPHGLGAAGERRPVEQPTLAVRLGERKLIRYSRGDGFAYSYFDLAEDPRERRDGYAAMQESLGDLKAEVDGYLEMMESVRARLASAADAPPPVLDPEREEKIRALGYIE